MIEFREGTATYAEIKKHLEDCDRDFAVRLSIKVDIGEYSTKILERAQTFEAWSGDTLVGLVAAYLNDSRARAGFITNVTVARPYMGRGIASQLLNRCLDKAKRQGLSAISLEANEQSRDAINLYRKIGFVEVGRNGEVVSMSLSINEKHDS